MKWAAGRDHTVSTGCAFSALLGITATRLFTTN